MTDNSSDDSSSEDDIMDMSSKLTRRQVQQTKSRDDEPVDDYDVYEQCKSFQLLKQLSKEHSDIAQRARTIMGSISSYVSRNKDSGLTNDDRYKQKRDECLASSLRQSHEKRLTRLEKEVASVEESVVRQDELDEIREQLGTADGVITTILQCLWMVTPSAGERASMDEEAQRLMKHIDGQPLLKRISQLQSRVTSLEQEGRQRVSAAVALEKRLSVLEKLTAKRKTTKTTSSTAMSKKAKPEAPQTAPIPVIPPQISPTPLTPDVVDDVVNYDSCTKCRSGEGTFCTGCYVKKYCCRQHQIQDRHAHKQVCSYVGLAYHVITRPTEERYMVIQDSFAVFNPKTTWSDAIIAQSFARDGLNDTASINAMLQTGVLDDLHIRGWQMHNAPSARIYIVQSAEARNQHNKRVYNSKLPTNDQFHQAPLRNCTEYHRTGVRMLRAVQPGPLTEAILLLEDKLGKYKHVFNNFLPGQQRPSFRYGTLYEWVIYEVAEDVEYELVMYDHGKEEDRHRWRLNNQYVVRDETSATVAARREAAEQKKREKDEQDEEAAEEAER